jgi:hypothetical protein
MVDSQPFALAGLASCTAAVVCGAAVAWCCCGVVLLWCGACTVLPQFIGVYHRYGEEIRLPTPGEVAASRQLFSERKGMQNCVAAIDGTHVPWV